VNFAVKQQHTYQQLLRDELELLRRLSIARRSASTRLPIVRRTGLTRPATRSDLDTNCEVVLRHRRQGYLPLESI
jgi:hypothetical protein